MNRSNVEEIKARLAIEDIIGSYVKVEKAGKSFKAKCPFHNEKTASFFISPERGGYYCFGCFPPGQLVRTPFGYHSIETLDAKHYVYSGKGKIRTILATQYREYRGKIVSVDVQKLGGTVSMTSDHQLPIIRPKTKYFKKVKQFYRQIRGYGSNSGGCISLNHKQIEKHADVLKIPAGELRVGDFVLYPIPTAVKNVGRVDLSTYLTKKHNKGPKVRVIPYIVPIDDDFLKLIGYYVAEGSNHRAYIRFSLGNHEEDFAQEIVSIIKNIFGLDAKIHRRKGKEKTGLEVTACHAYLADIFANLCGKGSSNKHIPFVFQELPFSKQMVIVSAINKGDGHMSRPIISAHIHNTITVVSRLLVEQIADILLRNSIFPSVYSAKKRIDKNGVNHKETYSVKWSSTAIARHELRYTDSGAIYWLLPVKKVSSKSYSGPVYNLTVDEDHTYATKNFAVSNCGAKGDIFSFVEQFEGIDFRGALKILAEKAGVQLSFDKSADGESDRMRAAMEDAAKFFESQLEKGKEALEYVRGRGINDETRKMFRIGWAPEGWTNLATYLKGKGYAPALIEKVGLIKQKEVADGSTQPISRYDRFRGRIMFPITDSSGRVIAFSGRILKDDGKSAKYLNSPDTPLYDKSLVLYGLDKAKSEIRRLNYSILVEGQMDLVMSHQAGIKNTVASSGTALTDEVVSEGGVVSNLGLVRRLSPNLIIAFDSDSAGRKAAMRASGIALGMGMDVKIADIIGGKDPADLVKDDVEKWRSTLKNAKPVIEFELDNVVREVADPRKLSKAIQERVLPLIAKMESASDQSHFVQMVSDRAKMTADIVWQDLKIVQKRLKDAAVSNTNANTSATNSNNAAMPNMGGANKSSANVRTSSEQTKRIDIVERRLFGLLYLMEKESTEKAQQYRDQLRKIADDSYEEREKRAQTMKSDLLFEAEEFFGAVRDSWDKQAEILLSNFEEDLVNEEIIRTMQELKVAENNKDKELLGELVNKCQALSMRKAEIGKKRKG